MNETQVLWQWVETSVDYNKDDRGLKLANNRAELLDKAGKYFIEKSELSEGQLAVKHCIKSNTKAPYIN